MHYSFTPRSTSFLVCLFLISFFTPSCKRNSQSIPEGFQIEKGFLLTKVASEPIVIDPVDLEFDEHGRTFVMEMPGYPMEDKESRIKILYDNNGDGLYDSSSVYAENLRMANSMMPYKKGMLVAAPTTRWMEWIQSWEDFQRETCSIITMVWFMDWTTGSMLPMEVIPASLIGGETPVQYWT